MTASLPYDYDLTLCAAPTLDMRPYPLIDVGPLPDACEQTLVGPAPTRPPAPGAVRAVMLSVLPDLDTATPDDISDLAANCASDTQQASDDLWLLASSQPHIRAICVHLGATEMALTSHEERIENLSATVDSLSRQYTGALALASDFERKFERSDAALAQTTAELYAERNRALNLEVTLHADRQRLEREGAMHRDTMKRLIAQTGALHLAGRSIEKLSAEVKVLTAALEKCRGAK